MIFREVEDRDLIAKARRGDVEAYNLLVSRWEKRVFNYLLRLVSNREDALDLSQEVFLKAYQNLPKLDDPARFSAWLFRIAHNEAFSLLRRRRPEGELTREPRPPDLGGRLLPIELSLAVESALERLSEDQREAVLLKVYQGFKFDEMAEILECPVSTVKSRLYTALDLLKATLAPAHVCEVNHELQFESYRLEGVRAGRAGRSDAPRRRKRTPLPVPSCREELARLRLTLDALSTLREEEMPRRIAFVSDKVFEPRWWQSVPASVVRGGVRARRGDSGARLRAAGPVDRRRDSGPDRSRRVTKAVSPIPRTRHAETAARKCSPHYEHAMRARRFNQTYVVRNTGIGARSMKRTLTFLFLLLAVRSCD